MKTIKTLFIFAVLMLGLLFTTAPPVAAMEKQNVQVILIGSHDQAQTAFAQIAQNAASAAIIVIYESNRAGAPNKPDFPILEFSALNEKFGIKSARTRQSKNLLTDFKHEARIYDLPPNDRTFKIYKGFRFHARSNI